MPNQRHRFCGIVLVVAFLFGQTSCADSRGVSSDLDVPVRTSLDGIGLRSGDLIFQTTPGFAGDVLQEGLNSRWTHVGVAMLIADRWFAIEAADSVTYTPLDQFISAEDAAVNSWLLGFAPVW